MCVYVLLNSQKNYWIAWSKYLNTKSMTNINWRTATIYGNKLNIVMNLKRKLEYRHANLNFKYLKFDHEHNFNSCSNYNIWNLNTVNFFCLGFAISHMYKNMFSIWNSKTATISLFWIPFINYVGKHLNLTLLCIIEPRLHEI